MQQLIKYTCITWFKIYEHFRQLLADGRTDFHSDYSAHYSAGRAIICQLINVRLHVRIQSGRQGVRTPPPSTKSQRMKRILSNTGPDPLKNHKAIKPTFNVGQSSACQRNAIQLTFRWRTDDGQIAFHWRADDCPLIVVFGSSLDSQLKKKTKKKLVGIWLSLTNFSGSAHGLAKRFT